MGKIDIDYQKLHDAFFKYQRKPKMTLHGDLYYEVWMYSNLIYKMFIWASNFMIKSVLRNIFSFIDKIPRRNIIKTQISFLKYSLS